MFIGSIILGSSLPRRIIWRDLKTLPASSVIPKSFVAEKIGKTCVGETRVLLVVDCMYIPGQGAGGTFLRAWGILISEIRGWCVSVGLLALAAACWARNFVISYKLI